MTKIDAMVEQQDGKCQMCEEPFGRGKRRPVMVHRKTGAPLGAIHHRCNEILSTAGYDVDLLKKVLSYIGEDAA
jgi:hypothetical protein